MGLPGNPIIACVNMLFHVTSDHEVHPTLARMDPFSRRYTFESLPRFTWQPTASPYLPIVAMNIAQDWLEAVRGGEMRDL